MTHVRNLLDILDHHAQSHPEKIAFNFIEEHKEKSITYLELHNSSKQLAAELQSQSLEGERAIILFPPGIDYIISFLGCLYAQVIPVPAYPPAGFKEAEAVDKLLRVTLDSQAKVVMSHFKIEDLIHKKNLQNHTGAPKTLKALDLLNSLQWIDGTTSFKQVSDWSEPDFKAEEIAFLQYTSGSTGHPKGVIVGHDNILANLKFIADSSSLNHSSHVVSWLPPYHDMGLIGGILYPLYIGCTCHMMSPISFLMNPFLWLKTISETGAEGSGAPDFAYALCTKKISDEQLKELDLSDWKTCFTGAEPIRSRTIDEFSKKFSICGFDKKTFFPCYGLAESTLMVTASDPNTVPNFLSLDPVALEKGIAELMENSTKKVMGSGNQYGDNTIIIVDSETLKQKKDCEVGEVWINSTCNAKGYWNKPELTEKMFQATQKDYPGKKFLRSGDLGFKKNGELYITSRMKDLIIIENKSYAPSDLESAAELADSLIRPGCGAAFSTETSGKEELCIVFEVKPECLDTHSVELNIKQALLKTEGVKVNHVMLIEKGSIPKTSSGKIRRAETKKQFIQQKLKPFLSQSSKS